MRRSEWVPNLAGSSPDAGHPLLHQTSILPFGQAALAFGSQKDEADTRHRRSSKESRQNELLCTLSSRTLATDFGARLFCASTKPPREHRDLTLAIRCPAHHRREVMTAASPMTTIYGLGAVFVAAGGIRN